MVLPKSMLNSIVCVLCLYVLWLSAVSGQYVNQIFTNAVTSSSSQVLGGSSTEDVVGNIYQVFMFTSGTHLTIGEFPLVNQGGFDTALVKFDPTGNVTWVRTLQTPGNEEFLQVTTDPAGNVYAVGYTDSGQDGITIDYSWDGILAKYDTNGNLLYMTNRYSNAFFSQQVDAILSVVYSNDYLYFAQLSDRQVLMIFQTNLQGVVQWNYQLPMSSVSWNPAVFQIAVDPLRNNLYVAGQIYGTIGNFVSNGKTISGFSSQGWDGFLLALSTSGYAEWVQPQQSSSGDCSYGVAVDSAGYVYVSACISGSVDGQSYSSGCNPMVQKYDWNGNRQWTRIYSQYANYWGAAVLMDNTGAFYTRAISTNSGGNQYIIKSDTNGNVIWAENLAGTTDVVVGCSAYLQYQWCRGGSSAYIDGSGALTLTGVFSSNFYGWASNQWVPYVSKWQLNNTCQSCAQFDAVLTQLQTLLNVVVN